MPPRTRTPHVARAESYHHPESELPMRPEVGTQGQFRKKKPPHTYRYDSSLAPELNWDGQNPAREKSKAALRALEEALARVHEQLAAPPAEVPAEQKQALNRSAAELRAAAERLKALGRPFLNWAGKAERLSFEVPGPHAAALRARAAEHPGHQAILETLKGHRRDEQTGFLDLFGDPCHSLTDQVLGAYAHMDRSVNRIVLGNSLVVMNSLLHYKKLGGQVQRIYMDPPYGVKFGSNFQPFMRKRDVKHNDDADVTREPEMVQAYRDTWELGLHSYLTYLRDRLLLARDLLTASGSIFVQIDKRLNCTGGRGRTMDLIAFQNYCCQRYGTR
ncbi:hypothetical protein BH24GEM3_BH24GEM3_05330 [soil metagenome]